MPNRVRNALNNESGFSLAEVLVAAGLLGVVSLGAVKITGMLNKNMKTAEVKYDKIEIVKEIATILADPDACTNTFAGENASKGEVDNIKDDTGKIKFEKSKKFGIQSMEVKSFMLDDSFPDVSVVPSGKGDTYLLVKFVEKKNSLGNKDGRIKLKVEVDASSKIISCNSISGGSSLWQRTSIDPDSIFYQGNRVGVNTATPEAELDVNGALKVGDSSVTCGSASEGALKYIKKQKGLFLCSDSTWKKVLLEEPFVWVNANNPSDNQNATCTKMKFKVATDQGYGICASGEAQPVQGEGAEKIIYKYGTWGGASKGGTIPIASRCYKPGQKQDGDATDTLVAWLCRRY